MPSPIITIENLGKCFTIERHAAGLSGRSYRRLNEELGELFAAPIRRLLPKSATRNAISVEAFWALRGLSLTIERGERVGIIGRNGAGKSTMLKLLSRISTPTTGSFEVRGNLASLLEVGTGFHPELTGRENIFLNGSILGMKRYQIAAKFDEIVAFSGIDTHLDTPVKRYSSGMQVRLAFSVAAHLEPDVMIVDEVLAVGDARFQKKCLGKMNDVARTSDRTILFVTHTMNFVQNLCNRAVWLDAGQLKADSKDVNGVIQQYLETTHDPQPNDVAWHNPGGVLPNDFFEVLCLTRRGETHAARNDEPITFCLEVDLKQPDPRLMTGIAIFTEDNQLVCVSYDTDADAEAPARRSKGIQTLTCTLPAYFLNERTYRAEFSAKIHQGPNITEFGSCPISISFRVVLGNTQSPYWTEPRGGLCAPLLTWK